MIYLVFIALAITLFFVFRGTTQQYHSWEVIKERWFEVGLDNSLLFSSGSPQKGKELIRLDGQHSTYTIAISLLKDVRPCVMVEVLYPTELSSRLSTYPKATFNNMNKILAGEVNPNEETLEPIAQETGNRLFNKRLHPQITEQFYLLQEQYQRNGRGFEISNEKLVYRQNSIVHDPILLFPVLDEMVDTVNLLREHAEYLLVQ
jgi:hypothetical protein